MSPKKSWRDGIPEILSKGSGLFAGGMMGYAAGEAIGGQLEHALPWVSDDSHLLSSIGGAPGAFGGAYAGYMLAKRQPAAATLMAAALAARPDLVGGMPSSPIAAVASLFHPHHTPDGGIDTPPGDDQLASTDDFSGGEDLTLF